MSELTEEYPGAAQDVALALSRAELKQIRVYIEYGNAETGCAFSRRAEGYIVRSTGKPAGVPCVQALARSTAAEKLQCESIVVVGYANRRQGDKPLYRHPKFHMIESLNVDPIVEPVEPPTATPTGEPDPRPPSAAAPGTDG